MIYRINFDEEQCRLVGLTELAVTCESLDKFSKSLKYAKMGTFRLESMTFQMIYRQYKPQTALSGGDAQYLSQYYSIEADALVGDASAYAAYLAAIETAQREFNAEQCRLAGLLHDSLDTGVNTVEDGTTSIDVQVCFVAGTPILMGDETNKPIEKIVIEDIVLARPHDDPTGPLRKCRVVQIYKNEPQSTWKLTFDNGLTVQATKEHPFLVREKGWTPAETLQIGDLCVNADGQTTALTAKEFVVEKQPVYNFEVEECHTYFVGKSIDESVLVHNDCTICNGTGFITKPQVIYGPRRGTPQYYTQEPCVCQKWAVGIGASIAQLGYRIEYVEGEDARVNTRYKIINFGKDIPKSARSSVLAHELVAIMHFEATGETEVGNSGYRVPNPYNSAKMISVSGSHNLGLLAELAIL